MPRTILIFLFGDLGDTILTVPAVRAIRNRYPGAQILLLGKQVAADYLRPLALADDYIVVDKHLFDRPSSLLRVSSWIQLLAVVRSVRRSRPDTVLLFHHLTTRWGTLKFALLSLASGARRRIGLDNGRGWFLTGRVLDRGFGARHEVEYWLEVAGLVDAKVELTSTLAAHLEAPISEEDRAAATKLIGATAADRFFAVHPGTGAYGPGRKWSANKFAEATNLVVEATGMRCVVVGTDEEASEGEVVATGVPGALNLVGRTSVGQLAAVLERCRVLLANDGGVAHLAAAAGTPVVAVFGPSNERAWRPLLGTVVSSDLPCRPCFYRDFSIGQPFGYPPRECLQLVSPQMVASAVLKLVRESKNPDRATQSSERLTPAAAEKPRPKERTASVER